MTAILSTPSAPAAGFQPGDMVMVSVCNLDLDFDGVLDRETGVIYMDQEAAADPERAAHVLADTWQMLIEQRRPQLTALDGGGRSTKRRAHLRLV